MLPKDTFTDRETQVIKIALKCLADNLTRTLALTHIKMNEYDILEPRHTLAHTLTALDKIVKLTTNPPTHFQNPQQPKDHPPTATEDHPDVATLQQ